MTDRDEMFQNWDSATLLDRIVLGSVVGSLVAVALLVVGSLSAVIALPLLIASVESGAGRDPFGQVPRATLFIVGYVLAFGVAGALLGALSHIRPLRRSRFVSGSLAGFVIYLCVWTMIAWFDDKPPDFKVIVIGSAFGGLVWGTVLAVKAGLRRRAPR